MQYYFVRAKDDGVWEMAADHASQSNPNPRPPRHLVRVLVEEGVWNVDNKGVEVERGLVVGYQRLEDAEYMLTGHHPRKEAPRAEKVIVQAGMIVCFYDEKDAHWAVRSGKADSMTPTEVMQAMEAAHAALQQAEDETPEDSEMHNPNLENKAAQPAAETKAPKPAEKPKPVAKKGK